MVRTSWGYIDVVSSREYGKTRAIDSLPIQEYSSLPPTKAVPDITRSRNGLSAPPEGWYQPTAEELQAFREGKREIYLPIPPNEELVRRIPNLEEAIRRRLEEILIHHGLDQKRDVIFEQLQALARDAAGIAYLTGYIHQMKENLK